MMMPSKSSICLLLFFASSLACGLEPDATMPTPQYIQSRGFVSETHNVTTKDGYILTHYRIVNPYRSRNSSDKLLPVVLNHCLLCSGQDWIMNSPGGSIYSNDWPDDVLRSNFKAAVDKVMHTSGLNLATLISRYGQSKFPLPPIGNNIGFELARYGYDVWLLNMRGNRYSRGHVKLNSNTDTNYWKFTIDDFIAHDLPESIDYILNVTDSPQIHYVGFSQGSNVGLSMLSTSPAYSEKIKRLIIIAPAMSIAHMKTPLKYVFDLFAPVVFYPHAGEVMTDDTKFNQAIRLVCFTPVLKGLCEQVTFLFAGFDSQHLNASRIGVYTKQCPAGTGSWVMEQYRQTMHSKNMMAKFDFGRRMNVEKYGQETPPIYDMSRVKHSHLTLIHTQNDWLGDLEDFNILKKALTVKPMIEYKVPIDSWNHLDPVRATDVGQWLNPQILTILLKADL